MIVVIRTIVEKTVKIDDEDGLQDRMGAITAQMMEIAEDLDAADFTELVGSSFRILKAHALEEADEEEETEEDDAEDTEEEEPADTATDDTE